MSPIRLPKLHDFTSPFSKARGRLRRPARRSPQPLKFRNLTIDPLEERQLLTVGDVTSDITETFTTYTYRDLLVNQTYSAYQETIAGQSIAVDDDGDFVVTWARLDQSPHNGTTVNDWNIYARYFTDEMQRLTIPAEVLANNTPLANGYISLLYGGDTGNTVVQKLTISAATEEDSYSQENISASFGLSFNGVDLGTFVYDESLGAPANATTLQNLLQGVGGVFAQAEVVAINAREFQISFAADYGRVNSGVSQPLLTWSETVSVSSGFLPAISVDRIREPYLLAGIPVIAGDAVKTAANIQYAINSHGVDTVTVTPNSTNSAQFDITFVGTSGKQNHPLMKIVAAVADNGVIAPNGTVVTLKESSDEFRVNAAESDDPDTMWADYTDQTAPAVAIDPDGDFVITWQSTVAETTPVSVSDVYARRFSPIGWVADTNTISSLGVQGVKPLGNEFRVNTTTANAQGTPAVAMDDDGNFMIVWASTGQTLSYFNGVYGQRFNLDGDRVGNEILIQAPDTREHFDPYVSLSGDGYAAITWTTWTDVGHGNSHLTIYNPSGEAVYQSQLGAIAIETTSSFDDHDNLLVSWTEIANGSVDADQGGNFSYGVRAMQLSLFDAQGNLAIQVSRPTFRVNSASSDAGSQPTWAWDQQGSQAMLDADGDVIITYAGYGADLPNAPLSATDTDRLIEEAMSLYMDNTDIWTRYGISRGAPVDQYPAPMNYELARHRLQLEQNNNLYRGSADDVLYTRIDANPGESPSFLDSDTVVQNTDSDAQNMRLYLVFPAVTSGGSVTLRCWNPMSAGGYQDINISFDNEDGVPLIADMEEAINDAFEGLPWVGTAYSDPPYAGPVTVRWVDGDEIQQRAGTPWEISGAFADDTTSDTVFEVTFIGSAHDFDFYVDLFKNELEAAAVSEIQYVNIYSTTETGYFRLALGSGGTPTDLIYFDPNNYEAVAEAMQAALEAADGGAYAGVEVEAAPIAGGFGFTITYGGDSEGKNIPAIRFIEPTVADGVPRINAGKSWGTQTNGHTEQYPDFQVVHFSHGDAGTIQAEASAGMEPDGDITVVWTQYEQSTSTRSNPSYFNNRDYYYYSYNSYTNNNIYYKLYNETTDTAGPTVTDFLLADGTRLAKGGQVNETMQSLIVTFDEELLLSGTYGVTNTANWVLLKDGVEVIGGIKSVSFGMSKSSDLAGFNATGSNKWEAVITLDGNGLSAGTAALSDGHYQIIAKNTLRDVAGNPLRHTGVNVNGSLYEREFDVMTAATGEERVNAIVDGDQTTSSPQTVASDADGDYVVVWTDAQYGVLACLYDVDNTRTTSASTTPYQLTVSSNTTACYASVAMDADGDFVVTWSEQDTTGDWDVMARRFTATGEDILPPGSSEPVFQVNDDPTEDPYIQRNSTVAMDTDGDFVITWQSLDQDESGYGIYAKRFDPAGNAIGGVNEIQVLSFLDQFTGSFQLQYGDLVTFDITYPGSARATGFADSVEATIKAELGLDVTVEATSFSTLKITFNDEGNREQISVASVTPDSGSTGTVQASTLVEGNSSEFLVNDTTLGNQRLPSIAMSADGSFVISWTSSGQDGDAAYETNIYAKRFYSNEVVTGGAADTATTLQSGATKTTVDLTTATRQPLITTTDDPGNHTVAPGTGYDGVVMVEVNLPDGSGWMGSGSLLTTGMHILTAAHVACYDSSNQIVPASTMTVTFHLSTGDEVFKVSQIYVNPTYTGTPWVGGGDLAILVLESPAPTTVERYDIYRNDDELGRVFEKVGYGLTGTGETGQLYPAGTKHIGMNRYEATNVLLGDYGDELVYDFDNGTAQNDAFGLLGNIHDTGLGLAEASGAQGDSGGPTFIDGKIAGVTSYGMNGLLTDANPEALASFGDVGADVRVSLYAEWIDATLRTGASEFLVNQTLTDDGTLLDDDPMMLGDQLWSCVAMDAKGDFVISWSSYNQDGVGDGPGASANGQFGIYARRYDSQGVAVGSPFQVNTYAANNQQHSSVSMDADGDFTIVWESFQDRPVNASTTPLPDVANSYGIYAQRYARTALIGKVASLGVHGELGSEMAINTTTTGDQRYPGVAMDATGDFVVVWSGNGEVGGQEDTQGVFQTRFVKPKDDAGPMVTDIIFEDSPDGPVTVPEAAHYGSDAAMSSLVVYFSEALNTVAGGVNSVLNTSNWVLLRNGQVVYGGISGIDVYKEDGPNDGKYAYRVNFANAPLTEGSYVLTLKDRVQDKFKNALDGNADGTPGGNFSRSFSIGVGSVPTPDGPDVPGPDDEDDPISDNIFGDQGGVVVASDKDGNYVVVWVDYGFFGEGDIKAQRYDRFGQKQGNEIFVSSYTTGAQITPDVAMDDFGNFVVVWAGEGIGGDKIVEDSGIFARVFDSAGVAQGNQIRVNTYRLGNQITPAVAMDGSGNFIVTWAGQGSTAEYSGVYGHLFNILGQSKSNDFQINVATNGAQTAPDVAADANGNFTVVWTSSGSGQDGSSSGIYGRRYNAAGKALSSEFRVNNYTTSAQFDPAIAMDVDGDFVVVYTSTGQDKGGYGVYARRYNKAGAAQGTEFLVNQTTAQSQQQPAVAMDDSGKFIVSWTTFGQDNFDKLGPGDTTPKDNGIYARIFNADGTSYKYDLNKDGTAEALGEMRINATTAGDQVNSAVAMDANGDLVVAWVGPDAFDTAVYQRLIVLNPDDYVSTSGSSSLKDPRIPTRLTTSSSTPSTPATLALTGTAGKDTLEFIAGARANSWIVKLNGVVKAVASNVNAITFNGLGGVDTVLLTGTAQADKAVVKPGSVIFTGTGFSFTGSNVETFSVKGGDGKDTLQLTDSTSNDTLTIMPDSVTFTGGYSLTATGFEMVDATASGGTDTANLYDTAGDDTLTMTSTVTTLIGGGNTFRANKFEKVNGFATTGNDTAVLTGTTGKDALQVTPTLASLAGTTYTLKASGFDTIQASGNGGTTDTAQFTGAADSKDTLQAWPQKALMTNTTAGYSWQATGFATLTADGGTAGQDVVTLYDSTGNDTLVASPTKVTLTGSGYSLTASQFEDASVISTGKGTDVATLNDSAGDDFFAALASYARMYGTGYSVRAQGFDSVTGVGSTGRDTATIEGTTANDTFTLTKNLTTMTGGGLTKVAKYFDEVYLLGAGGSDTATITDATTPTSGATMSDLRSQALTEAVMFSGIKTVQFRKSTAKTYKNDVKNVDQILAYWK